MKFPTTLSLAIILLFTACNNENQSEPMSSEEPTSEEPTNVTGYKYLALGDSYTIGESVCDSCRFPAQLADSLEANLNEVEVTTQIIATTGWTTTNLLSAINAQNPSNDQDLVTLLIGVNNQYQGKPFSLYETEFVTLAESAVNFAKGEKDRVIIVSIPDYAYTPFGQTRPNPETISEELDRYNAFAKGYADANGISYVNITDITREGLNDAQLVASDNLHPSKAAYTRFVERLLPLAKGKIQGN